VNHALNIVAGVMTLIAHAAPAAAGHGVSPMSEPARGCPGLAIDVDCLRTKRAREPFATEAAGDAACFDVEMAGLSAQAAPTAPFDGIAVTRIGDELILVETSAVATNDLSMGHIEATSHTLTFPTAPGRPWDGAVVVTVDQVELLPLTPGVHPLLSVLSAVNGATGVISTSAGSFVDLTDPAGGRASWIVEGELCFEERR
jgi:hypothetical protein